MRRLSLLVALFSFLLIFNVSAYVIDGDSVVYEDTWARLRVTPHTAKSPVLDFEQTFTVTNKKSVGGDLCVAYIFDDALSSSNVWLEKTGLKNVWQADLHCDYEETQNGSLIPLCVDLGHNVEEEYSYYDNIKQYFTHDIVNGKHVYYSLTPLHFDGLESNVWKVRYKPSNGNGKWDLKTWNTLDNNCQNAYFDAGDRSFMTTLDPWWNVSYQYRMPVNDSLISNHIGILNGSKDFDLGGYNQRVWSVFLGDGVSLYFNNYTDYVVANDTDILPFEIEGGNRSGYDTANVWVYNNVTDIYNKADTTTISPANTGQNYFEGALVNATIRNFKLTLIGSRALTDDNDFVRINTTGTIQWVYFQQVVLYTKNQTIFVNYNGANNRCEWRPISGDFYYLAAAGGLDTGQNYNVGDIYDMLIGWNATSDKCRYIINSSTVNYDSGWVDDYESSSGDYLKMSGGGAAGAKVTIDNVFIFNSLANAYKLRKNWVWTIGYANLLGVEEANIAPYIVDIGVTPSIIYAGVDALFNITVSDVNGDNVTSYYNVTFTNGTLIINGTGLNNFTVSVGGGNYSFNDTINISIVPYDGVDYGNLWPGNVSFYVNNTPPVVDNINHTPSTVYNNSNAVFYLYFSDADGHNVTGFYNVSYGNGSVFLTGNVSGNGSVNVTSSYLNGGDVINITVVPYDGFSYGSAGSDSFVVESWVTPSEANNFIIAIIILLPMLFGFMLLFGAAIMDVEHGALKLFFMLLAFTMFFVSLHFALVSVNEFYNFGVMESLIGSTTYWVSIVFGVIITYFLIYIFYKGVYLSAQDKKNSRWNY